MHGKTTSVVAILPGWFYYLRHLLGHSLIWGQHNTFLTLVIETFFLESHFRKKDKYKLFSNYIKYLASIQLIICLSLDKVYCLQPILSASYPIQSNPIQSNPIQYNPIQSNPIQSNPFLSYPNLSSLHPSLLVRYKWAPPQSFYCHFRLY